MVDVEVSFEWHFTLVSFPGTSGRNCAAKANDHHFPGAASVSPGSFFQNRILVLAVPIIAHRDKYSVSLRLKPKQNHMKMCHDRLKKCGRIESTCQKG